MVNLNADPFEDLVSIAFPILPNARVVTAVHLAGEIGAPETHLFLSKGNKANP